MQIRSGLCLFVPILATACSDAIITIDASSSAGADHAVNVRRAHGGTGTVTSEVGGIACGTTCAARVPDGTMMVLTATSDAGSSFAGWSGPCIDASTTCAFAVHGDVTVDAAFDVVRPTVAIVTYGNGAGSVSATPTAVSCAGACALAVDHGAEVTLTASPQPGSVFLGWDGGECSGTGACVLTITNDQHITAVFGLAHSLVVLETGSGTGTVTSSPAGIACRADCSRVYSPGTVISLTAAAGADSQFDGWQGGGCTGTGACAVTVRAAALVKARFHRLCKLSVVRTGMGNGKVTSSPRGISCGTDCTEKFVCGTRVRLTAVASSSTFAGWSNGCSGTGGCTVTLVDRSTTIGAAFTVCGNRVVEPGEECDDGNRTNGDACDNNCTVPRCGNHIRDPGEECDDGNSTDGDTCESNCTHPRCGNGIVDLCEQCDDGNTVDGDGCEHDCRSPRCGNGILDPGEQCDDGNRVNGDACENNCTLPRCGNSIRDVGEECDDGNTTNGDGCDGNCTFPRCGNGILDPGEQCDDGNMVNGDSCENNCTLPQCGNGIIDADEQCDDGNTVAGDGCSPVCNIERCGNAILDPGEECDDGNLTSGDGCSAACRIERCGNGILDPGEQCDDGNLVNGDGCENNCTLPRCGNGIRDSGEQCDTGGGPSASCDIDCTAPQCGDGLVNPVFTPLGGPGPEQCDDGNATSGDGCSRFCRVERCGNGVIDPGEQCDDGNLTSGDGCSAACRIERCGNGIIDPGEQCDDGNLASGDGCSAACRIERCGNGIIDPGEQCDTSGSSATCDIDCTLPMCGDGVRNPLFTPPGGAGPEQCDDGNLINGDGCSSTCRAERDCGNGVLDPGEQCDTAGASATCDIDCTLPVCGDGVRNPLFTPPGGTGPEQCDTGGMSAACDIDCTLPVCGDGLLNLLSGEECDHGAGNGGSGDTCSASCRIVR